MDDELMEELRRAKRNLRDRILYAMHEKGLIFPADVIPEREPDESIEDYIHDLDSLRGEKLWELSDNYGDEEDDFGDDDDDYYDDLVIQTLEYVLDTFDPSRIPAWLLKPSRYKRSLIQQALDEATQSEGRENLAKRLNNVIDSGTMFEFANHAIYDSNSMANADDNPYLQKILSMLKSHPLTQNDAMALSSDYTY